MSLKTISLIILLFTPFLFSQSRASSPVNPILTGLDFPVSLKLAPDGRIFFNEKNTGSIRIIQPNGILLSTPFATVSPIFNGGEAGLLGIALDPAFSSNGYVYVYYTDRDANSYTRGHIRRYVATGNTGTSPLDIFTVTSSAPNTIYHNGGYIKFGPDGKLYAQVGEFHQSQRAQDPSTTDGKMLRMNPDGTPPGDNTDPTSLVYAWGIRNAFGFDFDSSNGRLIATEAGPTGHDEINIIVKGGNYGWPTCQGICHNPSFIDPIVEFNPAVTPTGIATVAPNVYYFGEYNNGHLVRLELSSTGAVVSMNQTYTQSGGIVAVEMGPTGLLYFTSPNAIYTYQVGSPIPPSTLTPALPYPVLLLIGIAAVIFVAMTVAYSMIRFRRKRSTPATTNPTL